MCPPTATEVVEALNELYLWGGLFAPGMVLLITEN
jgi:hypothetical protein